MQRYSLILTLFGALLLGMAACTKDYLNPSTASQPQVVGSTDGLITLCNGLQYRYTTGGALSVLYNAAAAGGLTTRELFVLNVGNIDEANLAAGAGNVGNGNAVVRNLWTQCQLVRANADLILANTGVVTDAGTRSGIVGYAAIFRALSLGTLAQFFQAAPSKPAPTPRLSTVSSCCAKPSAAWKPPPRRSRRPPYQPTSPAKCQVTSTYPTPFRR